MGMFCLLVDGSVSSVSGWSAFHLSVCGVYFTCQLTECFICHLEYFTCHLIVFHGSLDGVCFTCHLMEYVSPVTWSVFHLSHDGVCFTCHMIGVCSTCQMMECFTCHLMECVSLVSWWSVFHLLVDGVCFTCHLMEISVHVLNIGIQLDQRNVETA